MASSLRRGAVTAAILLVLVAAAILLVEMGVAVGGAGGPATDAAFTADIDAVLAADTGSHTASATAGDGRVGAGGIALRRLAIARRLVHATVLVDLPNRAGLTTIQLDHGTVATVSSSALTISETGGGSITVSLGDQTRVRKDAARAEIADLAAGDEVFVMSKVEGATAEAYLVVVPAT